MKHDTHPVVVLVNDVVELANAGVNCVLAAAKYGIGNVAMHSARQVRFDTKSREVNIIHHFEFGVMIPDEFTSHYLCDAFGRSGATETAIALLLEEVIREMRKDHFVQNLSQDYIVLDACTCYLDLKTEALHGLSIESVEVGVEFYESVRGEITIFTESLVCVVSKVPAFVVSLYSCDSCLLRSLLSADRLSFDAFLPCHVCISFRHRGCCDRRTVFMIIHG